MRNIEASWEYIWSLNCQSTDYLANLLIEKADRFQQKRRTAEPYRLLTAAIQQTLTELLLYLAKRMRQRYLYSSPLGMILLQV